MIPLESGARYIEAAVEEIICDFQRVSLSARYGASRASEITTACDFALVGTPMSNTSL